MPEKITIDLEFDSLEDSELFLSWLTIKYLQSKYYSDSEFAMADRVLNVIDQLNNQILHEEKC